MLLYELKIIQTLLIFRQICIVRRNFVSRFETRSWTRPWNFLQVTGFYLFSKTGLLLWERQYSFIHGPNALLINLDPTFRVLSNSGDCLRVTDVHGKRFFFVWMLVNSYGKSHIFLICSIDRFHLTSNIFISPASRECHKHFLVNIVQFDFPGA